MAFDDEAEESIAPAAAETAADGIALLFAEGQRPSAEAIDRLLGKLPAHAALSVSHRGDADSGVLELLCRGLSFDLTGLAPARSADMPVVMQKLELGDDLPQLEGVLLKAGRHLEGGAHLTPVLRAHLGVAVAMAGLPGLNAVIWAPSGVMMSPDYFVQTVGGWLKGGRFPAPGLIALLPGEDNALLGHGLSFFTPRQVRVEAFGASEEAQAEIASALIDRLVDGDGHVPAWVTASDGQVWNVSWQEGQGLVTARRNA